MATNYIARLKQIFPSGARHFYVLSNGNVGIGKAAPGSALAVLTLPTHADNTAALAAGLTAGDLYRTSAGVVMVTFPAS